MLEKAWKIINSGDLSLGLMVATTAYTTGEVNRMELIDFVKGLLEDGKILHVLWDNKDYKHINYYGLQPYELLYQCWPGFAEIKIFHYSEILEHYEFTYEYPYYLEFMAERLLYITESLC